MPEIPALRYDPETGAINRPNGMSDSWWRPIADLPPFNERPQRHFVIIEGWKSHHGRRWARAYWGIAYTHPDGQFGYRRKDITRLRIEGDMDVVDGVTYWMPAVVPGGNDAVRGVCQARNSGAPPAPISIAARFSIHPSTVSRITRNEWRKEVS